MILISGSSGIIGKELLKIFTLKKIKVRILTRNKKDLNIKNKNFEYYFVKDIIKVQSEEWNKILINVDKFIHLAWYNKHNDYLKSKKNIICKDGTIRIAKICKIRKIKHFIGIGTCADYKPSNNKLNINSKLKSKTLYGKSKILTYLQLKENFKNSETIFSWCRLFYVYSDKEKKNKLYNYISEKLKKNKTIFLKNPNNVYDFISAAETAKKIYKIINKRKSNVYNICSGKGQSVIRFTEKLKKKINSKSIINLNNKKQSEKIIGINRIF